MKIKEVFMLNDMKLTFVTCLNKDIDIFKGTDNNFYLANGDLNVIAKVVGKMIVCDKEGGACCEI